MSDPARNVAQDVVDDFGREWQAYNQRALDEDELRRGFDEYFRIFPFETLSAEARGFDMGCGSGRWARLAAEKVGFLTCIDPSPVALAEAKTALAGRTNVAFENAAVDSTTLADGSQDFGYSLGVLHHIPDTAAGLRSCVAKLKPGAPFLVYLYYRFDNKPLWFRAVWRVSDVIRRGICVLPFRLKRLVCDGIALTVYWPLSRAARLMERLGLPVGNVPLTAYRNRSVYALRTDALDRFGTKLERRFTRVEIDRMMREAGLEDIRFSDAIPYWCAVGTKAGGTEAEGGVPS